jgi:hypothetical protein
MQHGCMARLNRKRGPEVWQFRWSVTGPDGKRLYHKKIVGTVERYPRYHAPSDDMNQALDFDASVEFMQINFLVGYDIAQTPQRPMWKPGDFFGETFARK